MEDDKLQRFDAQIMSAIMEKNYFQTKQKVIDEIAAEFSEIANLYEGIFQFDLGSFKNTSLGTLATTIDLNECRFDIVDKSELLTKDQIFANAYRHNQDYLILPSKKRDS